jgi:hypothetical protein
VRWHVLRAEAAIDAALTPITAILYYWLAVPASHHLRRVLITRAAIVAIVALFAGCFITLFAAVLAAKARAAILTAVAVTALVYISVWAVVITAVTTAPALAAAIAALAVTAGFFLGILAAFAEEAFPIIAAAIPALFAAWALVIARLTAFAAFAVEALAVIFAAWLALIAVAADCIGFVCVYYASAVVRFFAVAGVQAMFFAGAQVIPFYCVDRFRRADKLGYEATGLLVLWFVA